MSTAPSCRTFKLPPRYGDAPDPGVRLAVRGPGGITAAVVIVDFDDAARVSAHKWRVLCGGRVIVRDYVRGGRRRTQSLQRFLAGPYFGEITFVNGDRFDFRRANLVSLPGRIVHRTDARRRRPWSVIVPVDGRDYRCGVWPSQWLAEQALRSARAILPELIGRGYKPNRIQFRLARACGLIIFASDSEAQAEA